MATDINSKLDELLSNFDGDLEAIQIALRQRKQFDNLSHHATSFKYNSAEAIISIKDISKKYIKANHTIEAVHNISLDIYSGEFIAITGPSGGGKSTLLHLIGGVDKPTNGAITIGKLSIDKMNDHELSNFRNQKIGFIFQSFYLQPFLTVAQNIEVAAMPNGTDRNLRRERIEELANQVGLSDRLNHKPYELSGGQIQRVAIARALMNNPDIIIADEPTGNLDSLTSKDIVNLFKKIQQKFDTTIIIATHDTTIASQADRSISIIDGKIV